MPELVDLLVTRACLVTLEGTEEVIPDGAVAISNGRIAAIGPREQICGAYAGRDCIDARGGIVHPGFIETHLHLTSIAFHGLQMDALAHSSGRGYGDIKAATTAEAESAFAAAAAIALMRKGFTLFAEPGTAFETDAVAEAVTGVGTRAMLTATYAWDDLTLLERGMPGLLSEGLRRRAPPDARRVLDQLASELKRNDNADALVRGFVGLYGEGSGSNELICAAKRLARERRAGFQQHQCYYPATTELERARHGCSPIRRLQELGVLDEATTLIHLNIIDAEDVEMLIASGASAIWCPLNSLHRGLHREWPCRHPALLKRGVPVALGVDTTLTFPLGVAGLAALLLSGSAGEALTARDVLHMQTKLAARVLGLSDELGTLAPGKRADLVVRARGDLTQQPVADPLFLLGASSATLPVDTVVVAGRVVMRDGMATHVDEAQILAHAVAQRRALLSRIGLAR